MNIDQSFAQFLATTSGSVLGQDLFIGQAPSSNKVADAIWWIVATGGNRVSDNVTGGGMKNYSVEVYYRSRNYKLVYDELQDLEIALNCDSCVQLEDFVTIDIKAAVLSIDEDLDDEDRKVGLLQADLTVYEGCNA